MLKNQVFVYLGTDNHLYIPDREILSLDLTVLTPDTIEAERVSQCNEKDCKKSNWQYECICNDRLIEAVKDMVLQKLSITRNLVEDQSPDNREGN